MRFRPRLRTLALLIACALQGAAFAAPLGGNFKIGSGTIGTNGSATSVNVTPMPVGTTYNAYIQWDGGFNVANGETVNFTTSAPRSNVINYDPSGSKSVINGTVTAPNTMNLVLINPNGVSVGSTAVVSARSLALIRGTAQIADASTGSIKVTILPGDLDIAPGASVTAANSAATSTTCAGTSCVNLGTSGGYDSSGFIFTPASPVQIDTSTAATTGQALTLPALWGYNQVDLTKAGAQNWTAPGQFALAPNTNKLTLADGSSLTMVSTPATAPGASQLNATVAGNVSALTLQNTGVNVTFTGDAANYVNTSNPIAAPADVLLDGYTGTFTALYGVKNLTLRGDNTGSKVTARVTNDSKIDGSVAATALDLRTNGFGGVADGWSLTLAPSANNTAGVTLSSGSTTTTRKLGKLMDGSFHTGTINANNAPVSITAGTSDTSYTISKDVSIQGAKSVSVYANGYWGAGTNVIFDTVNLAAGDLYVSTYGAITTSNSTLTADKAIWLGGTNNLTNSTLTAGTDVMLSLGTLTNSQVSGSNVLFGNGTLTDSTISARVAKLGSYAGADIALVNSTVKGRATDPDNQIQVIGNSFNLDKTSKLISAGVTGEAALTFLPTKNVTVNGNPQQVQTVNVGQTAYIDLSLPAVGQATISTSGYARVVTVNDPDGKLGAQSGWVNLTRTYDTNSRSNPSKGGISISSATVNLDGKVQSYTISPNATVSVGGGQNVNGIAGNTGQTPVVSTPVVVDTPTTDPTVPVTGTVPVIGIPVVGGEVPVVTTPITTPIPDSNLPDVTILPTPVPITPTVPVLVDTPIAETPVVTTPVAPVITTPVVTVPDVSLDPVVVPPEPETVAEVPTTPVLDPVTVPTVPGATTPDVTLDPVEQVPVIVTPPNVDDMVAPTPVDTPSPVTTVDPELPITPTPTPVTDPTPDVTIPELPVPVVPVVDLPTVDTPEAPAPVAPSPVPSTMDPIEPVTGTVPGVDAPVPDDAPVVTVPVTTPNPDSNLPDVTVLPTPVPVTPTVPVLVDTPLAPTPVVTTPTAPVVTSPDVTAPDVVQAPVVSPTVPATVDPVVPTAPVSTNVTVPAVPVATMPDVTPAPVVTTTPEVVAPPVVDTALTPTPVLTPTPTPEVMRPTLPEATIDPVKAPVPTVVQLPSAMPTPTPTTTPVVPVEPVPVTTPTAPQAPTVYVPAVNAAPLMDVTVSDEVSTPAWSRNTMLVPVPKTSPTALSVRIEASDDDMPGTAGKAKRK